MEHQAYQQRKSHLFGLRLRPARLDDLPKITRLEQRVWKELSADYQDLRRRFLQFPKGLQVAFVYSELAGFCSSCLFDVDAVEAPLDEHFPPRHVPGGKYFFLLGLTVNPAFRKRGVGTELVKREVALARRLRCRKVQLIANAESQGLFEAAGFQVLRELRHLFRDFSKLMNDPVLMELSLGERN